MNDREMYEQVMRANVALHDRMAASYRACEPHFRPENVAIVQRKLRAVADAAGRGRMLDLGCGTGFMIEIGRPIFAEIHGVDVSEKMLDQATATGAGQGDAGDSGSVPVEAGTYDVVTSYPSCTICTTAGPPCRRRAAPSNRAGGCTST
jgi:ubiquinone/menaquinone biosynthesis C-methylase UbiE